LVQSQLIKQPSNKQADPKPAPHQTPMKYFIDLIDSEKCDLESLMEAIKMKDNMMSSYREAKTEESRVCK
jgi:hypothetical protein